MSDPSFQPVTRAQWQAKASDELRGRPLSNLTRRTADGIEVPPLYLRDDLPGGAGSGIDSLPGQYPGLRGRGPAGAAVGLGWWTLPELRHADVEAANAAARRDIELGANAVLFMLDRELRAGRGPSSRVDGLVAVPERDLSRLLSGIDPLRTPVLIDAGVLAPRWADALEQWLDDHAEDRGPERAQLGRGPAHGGVVYDPFAALLGTGRLERPLDEALAGTVDAVLGMRAGLLGISVAPYHDAGAGEADELALALASCAELLRRGEPLGLSFEDLAGSMLWTLALGNRPFESIAKLRAARVVWAKLCAALGHADVGLWIHATPSQRCWTRHAPWVNLLRGTIASFAGAVGGADSVATAPFDGLCGPDQALADGLGRGSELGRRLALDAQVILREESHLGAVIDPAGGSWYVEALTDKLARAAWDRFRAIEREGGLVAGLTSGSIVAHIEAAAARLREQAAKRKLALTGLSTYPILDDHPTPDQPDNHAAAYEDVEASQANTSIRPLVRVRLPEPFEQLRDAAAAWAAEAGAGPRMFALCLGPIPSHQARLEFAGNCFGAAGISLVASEPISTDDPAQAAEQARAAMQQSGCTLAIICGSDADYPRLVVPVLAALRAGGATQVWVAGRPPVSGEWGPEPESPPRFVFLGADVLSELEQALTQLGAIQSQGQEGQG